MSLFSIGIDLVCRSRECRHVANCLDAVRKERSRGGGEETKQVESVSRERISARERAQNRMEARRVICDSKRAIHLATCQDSIVGICLWNQSQWTYPPSVSLIVHSRPIDFCQTFSILVKNKFCFIPWNPFIPRNYNKKYHFRIRIKLNKFALKISHVISFPFRWLCHPKWSKKRLAFNIFI